MKEELRNVNGPKVFLVFQGINFDKESKGGYIWAPKKGATGRTIHYWDRLLDVREGDVIFHCHNGYIKAISCAKGSCYDNERPQMPTNWERYGRKVDLDYRIRGIKLKHGNYRTEIINYHNGLKKYPFKVDGTGKIGYLFELNKELAKFFLSKMDNAYPSLRDETWLDFLR